MHTNSRLHWWQSCTGQTDHPKLQGPVHKLHASTWWELHHSSMLWHVTRKFHFQWHIEGNKVSSYKRYLTPTSHTHCGVNCRIQTHPKCLSVHKWMKELQCVYTMEKNHLPYKNEGSCPILDNITELREIFLSDGKISCLRPGRGWWKK